MQPLKITGSTIFHMELDEGMDHDFKFQYLNDSTLLPVDLTGWEAELQVKMTMGSVQVLNQLSSKEASTKGSISLSNKGLIQVSINGEFTLGAQWSDAFYDLVLINAASRKTKLLRGKIHIYNTVTLPAINVSSDAMSMRIERHTLPNKIEAWGFMDAIRLGIGGGVQSYGLLTPFIQDGFEVIELSWASYEVSLKLRGNVNVSDFSAVIAGYAKYKTAEAVRVFDNEAIGGLGLTSFVWNFQTNPFYGLEGSTLPVSLVTT